MTKRARFYRQGLDCARSGRPLGTSHATGTVTADLLADQSSDDRDVDPCVLGPKPFMQSIYASGLALGIAPGRLRYEFFGPLEDLRAA